MANEPSSTARRECEHDYRRDPFVTYPTNPPQERIVCALCGHSWLRVMTASPHPDAIATWPKA